MVNVLGGKNTIFDQFISELRDVEIQQDPLRFRRNLERLGELLAYELSKTLDYTEKEVTTSLGTAKVPVLKSQPVLATILRAGLPLHQGFLNYFDRSECAFISAYRKTGQDGEFTIQVEYASSPDLTDKTVILIDPMLATGSSMVLTYRAMLNYGKPRHTHIVSVLSSLEGINYVKKQMPDGEYTLWTGAIDDELTAQAYIVPGLGDAGDLAYGKKL